MLAFLVATSFWFDWFSTTTLTCVGGTGRAAASFMSTGTPMTLLTNCFTAAGSTSTTEVPSTSPNCHGGVPKEMLPPAIFENCWTNWMISSDGSVISDFFTALSSDRSLPKLSSVPPDTALWKTADKQ